MLQLSPGSELVACSGPAAVDQLLAESSSFPVAPRRLKTAAPESGSRAWLQRHGRLAHQVPGSESAPMWPFPWQQWNWELGLQPEESKQRQGIGHA